MNPNIKSKRHAMLGRLFIEAQERGISSEQLRDEIAPGLIGRRLSAASEKQIGLVLTHIAGPRGKMRNAEFGIKSPQSPFAKGGREGICGMQNGKKYESSLSGLKDEICDLAKARWGHPSPGPSPQEGEGQSDKDKSIESWELPLNNFCVRFGVKRWQWLDVAHGRAVKGALMRMRNAE